MRSLLFLLSLPTLFAASPELVKVKSVYILPMTNGMDQYLANHLQVSGIYVVVTDPQSADAVFTDSVGPGFEKRMTELYPAPVDEDADDDGAAKGDTGRPMSTRKGRGMVFLVERGSRHVVWSTFEPPKNVTTGQMNAAAKRITYRLQKDLGLTPPSK